MAVTQQLARVPAESLAICRHSVEALDALCSFTSIPTEDYLDMNWWPALLERAWIATGTDPSTLTVLRRAFVGDEEVNRHTATTRTACGSTR